MPSVYTIPSFPAIDNVELSEPGNLQGVAFDGVYHYVSDSFTIYRYLRDPATRTYTLVDSRNVTGDDPVTKTQINDMSYFDGYLWIGSNNFPGEDGGWIVQYNPHDLQWVATYDVEGQVNEGGAWRVDPVHGPEFWSVYSAVNHVSRWRNWVKVDDYYPPLVDDWVYDAGTSSIYDGAAWLGDYLICHAKGGGNLQEGTNHQSTQLHIHHWTGTAFTASNVIFTGYISAGQGIAWETDSVPTLDTRLLIAMRDPQTIYRFVVESLT